MSKVEIPEIEGLVLIIERRVPGTNLYAPDLASPVFAREGTERMSDVHEKASTIVKAWELRYGRGDYRIGIYERRETA